MLCIAFRCCEQAVGTIRFSKRVQLGVCVEHLKHSLDELPKWNTFAADHGKLLHIVFRLSWLTSPEYLDNPSEERWQAYLDEVDSEDIEKDS